ncbi:hypothetical protein [Haladaptatus sp. DFWS20]|uniref:HVO_A0114 family putative DNA-binding protein n=1 Tax=Haladaptatus sp. DFWS20 TaxID=3403467 RepID=UPI003EC127FB
MTTSIDYMRRLAEAGIDDLLLLSRETAEHVLTQKRMELVEQISTNNIESMRDLARHVDRDISIVKRDLDILYEAGVIEYETKGQSKRPILSHKNIAVKPIVFNGDVVD